MKSNTQLMAAAMLAATAHASPFNLTARDNTFQFASIGDSWASGVTYGINGYTNYDSNNPPCMRINHAYSVQLLNDWPGLGGILGTIGGLFGGTKPVLNFKACSGARLVDMVQGQKQLSQTPTNTKLVLMQAGGNDAGFFGVASDCIFHQDQNTDYGGVYPAPGRCASSVNDARNFVNGGPGQRGTYQWTLDTINDVLKDPRAKQSDFKLYVIGYAHFFNTNDNWCSKSSFSLNVKELTSQTRTPLSQKLRQDINDLTERLNNGLRKAVAAANSPKVKYIDVSGGYNNHRFCEDKHNIVDQYFNDDVWFWNASPSHYFSDSSIIPTVATAEIIAQAAEDADYTSKYVKNSDPAHASSYGWNWSGLFDFAANVHATSPNQNGSPGLALRPFHPKSGGHGAIKDAIKPQVLKDFPAS